MRSMTGFGRGEFSLAARIYRVEVRALNNRFLDVRVRLPWPDAAWEAQVVARVRRMLERGRVDVTVTRSEDQGTKPLVLNHALARDLGVALNELAKQLGGDRPLAAMLLSGAVPATGLLEGGDQRAPDAEALVALTAGLDQALADLDQMRLLEGAALQADLAQHGRRLSDLVTQIAARAADHPATLRARLAERLSGLLRDVALDEGRLAQEVALLAERADVSEELSRLSSHLDQWQALLEQAGSVGRRCEFLLQEMNREVNTVAAKSGDVEISGWVVEGKGILEKMREQIQNVE